ncbi:hypothetical protein LL037_01080 [Clostridium estertheticum]|uniref:Glycosyltransferase subfamily 4-like N-terminal domain-containing protein n=1 Tax=Clostridium estertheticum TaxID=238834 RepID=A0AA47EHA2_9CLOT|nr:hypothetical protein [Clostridium estertheticum]MBU3155542.1 hypothetical protein [Clostridium estertheticum]MBU3198066.1 hypothetical protein [Clostridium estertheticum]WAG60060.1 hypothetical protein LL038_21375 [Clostridium estertheticum]WAG65860.1 hypothetical protein LL037_01080 [Clostridium estertheticum]
MIKILHYALGLPPVNTGGLAKQPENIMVRQVANGNEVSLVYPGKISIDRGLKIKKNKSFNNIKVYQINNPISATLLSGEHNPKVSLRHMGFNIYIDFLKTIEVNIIHIHTLVNLDEEFISAANKMDIKIVFTAHDYLGICPKVKSIGSEETCTDHCNGEKCVICNR